MYVLLEQLKKGLEDLDNQKVFCLLDWDVKQNMQKNLFIQKI